MKKQILAAAALALISGAAAAQSSVTVYGFLDIGVLHTNNGGANGKSQTTMSQIGGNYFPSMFGITGSEDLGGGLKASFNLQSSLDVATGKSTTGLTTDNLFDRYASVKLSGAFGSVEVGRQLDLLFLQSVFNGVMLTHGNSLGFDGLVNYGGGRQQGGSNNAQVLSSRIDSAITYTTPTVNGVTGKFMYSVGGVAGDSSANGLYAGVVTYANGPLSLSAGYESQNNSNGVNNAYHKGLVGAKYAIGAVDLAAQYHQYKTKDSSVVDVSAYEAGVAYHLTPAATVGVNYEYFDDKANDTKPQKVSLKAKYDLSKRTYLYGMAARQNGDAGAMPQAYYATTGQAGKSTSNIAVGVVHGF